MLTPDQIIERFQVRAPVDVEGLASALGVRVWHGTLPSGISGTLFRDQSTGGSNGYSIIVNEKEPRVRQRFTVAHELGHFLLHRAELDKTGKVKDDIFYRSAQMSTRQEAQANRFAANLLMPKRLISYYQQLGTTSPRELARIFAVSEDAMLIQLGLK